MTPSFMGRMATMLPGVRPSISLAALPTASTLFVILFTATMDGSRTTIPRPSANTSVFAVPRSIARSEEKIEKKERRAKTRSFRESGGPERPPLWSITVDEYRFLLDRLAARRPRLDDDRLQAVAAHGDDLAEHAVSPHIR